MGGVSGAGEVSGGENFTLGSSTVERPTVVVWLSAGRWFDSAPGDFPTPSLHSTPLHSTPPSLSHSLRHSLTPYPPPFFPSSLRPFFHSPLHSYPPSPRPPGHALDLGGGNSLEDTRPVSPQKQHVARGNRQPTCTLHRKSTTRKAYPSIQHRLIQPVRGTLAQRSRSPE